MKSSSIGSLIGAVGGLMFVLLNAGTLPAPWPIVCRIVGVALFVATLGLAIRGINRPADDVQPRPRALRVYLVCVAAMIIAIPTGAGLLNRVELPSLTVLWVIFVVGAHFIPFHRAFRQPLFGYLGAALLLIAIIGGCLTVVDLAQPAAFAVAAGVTLLVFSLAGVVSVGGRLLPGRRGRPTPSAQTDAYTHLEMTSVLGKYRWNHGS